MTDIMHTQFLQSEGILQSFGKRFSHFNFTEVTVSLEANIKQLLTFILYWEATRILTDSSVSIVTRLKPG
jgi:hypothetical protein